MTSNAGVPAWQKNVMERVAGRGKPNRSGNWGSPMNILVSKDFRDLVGIACQRRDISRSGYIRRAVAKQVAKDLGLPVEKMLALSPRPTPWGVRTAPVQGGTGFKSYSHPPDDGEGYGDWGWDELQS